MKWANRVLALLAVLCGACSRDRSASTEIDAPTKTEVAVITDAAEIEVAHSHCFGPPGPAIQGLIGKSRLNLFFRARRHRHFTFATK